MIKQKGLTGPRKIGSAQVGLRASGGVASPALRAWVLWRKAHKKEWKLVALGAGFIVWQRA